MDTDLTIDDRALAAGRVALRGSLLYRHHDAFRALIARLTARDADVTLDLSGLSRLDSHGLGLLLVLREELARRGHRLTLVGTSGAVRRVFTLARLHSVFEMPEPSVPAYCCA